MAASNDSHTLSPADTSPRIVATGQSELLRASKAVEQMLDLQRIGTVITPNRDRPEEAWGVLNPASARSRDGTLFLFPRVVAEGNFSRIAMAAVNFDAGGNPAGVERLQIVLEPQESYEFAGSGAGGVEDPRITYIPLLESYIMTYTALGLHGARIALAVSQDLHVWSRLGLLHFEVTDGLDLNLCDNKDCVIFPLPVADPAGRPAFALLHRPIVLVPQPDGTTEWQTPPGATDRRPSIWISYVPVDRVKRHMGELTHVSEHQLLAQPIGNWELHHIGSGAPPVLSEEGWLLYYHGVMSAESSRIHAKPGSLIYQSGVMLLDRADPRHVLYRSSRPVLLPQEPGEQEGIVANVVFPTAVDVRGQRIDVYYGAADERISAATTQIISSVLLAPSAPPGVDMLHRLRASNGRSARRIGHGPERNSAPAGASGPDSPAALDRSPRPQHSRWRYERILVALDGSSLAEHVLASIVPLAQRFGSRLILLRAITPIPEPVMAAVGTMSAKQPKSGANFVPDAVERKDAESYLAVVQQRLASQRLKVEIECSEGLASEVILRRARELAIDLIAITTHGRTGVDRLLLGSVAEEVVRQAPCPVHLVRVRRGH